jgi:hypothetical protein
MLTPIYIYFLYSWCAILHEHPVHNIFQRSGVPQEDSFYTSASCPFSGETGALLVKRNIAIGLLDKQNFN